MDRAIVRRLVDLNRAFYEEFAAEFSASRARLHPGIVATFERWGAVSSLLDVGCGDARLGHAWVEGTLGPAWEDGRSRYVGIDNAAALLRARPRPDRRGFELREVDLVSTPWHRGVGRFGHVVSFSALHHVPGAHERAAFVRELAACLESGGRWAVSVWQILHRPRFADRIRPWSTVGLDASSVEPGDLLVDWRRGGRGVRYVHHFDEEEMVELISDNGLCVDSVWRSDGRTNDLGLYCSGRRA